MSRPNSKKPDSKCDNQKIARDDPTFDQVYINLTTIFSMVCTFSLGLCEKFELVWIVFGSVFCEEQCSFSFYRNTSSIPMLHTTSASSKHRNHVPMKFPFQMALDRWPPIMLLVPSMVNMMMFVICLTLTTITNLFNDFS